MRVWLIGLHIFCLASLISCQVQPLIDLYNSTGGDYWYINRGWLNGDPCVQNWYGVMCNDTNVFYINLRNNNLTGTIPDTFANLPGLGTLLLSSNKNLTGTIPDTFANLPTLRYLEFNHTSMSGSVSPLQEIKSLMNVDLSNAYFSGSLPEWSDLREFEYVNIANNNFTGTIPDSWSASRLLRYVYLNQNGLSGTIPQFLSSTIRGYLDLSDNYFDGVLPNFLQQPWPANLENNYFTCPLANWCSAPPLGDGSCEPCFSTPVESYSGTPSISLSISFTRTPTRTPTVTPSNSYSQTPPRTPYSMSPSRTPTISISPIPLIKPSFSILGITVISFSLLMCLVCCAIAFACVSRPKQKEAVGLLND